MITRRREYCRVEQPNCGGDANGNGKVLLGRAPLQHFFIYTAFVSAMELLYNVCPKVLIGILFAQEGHVHQNRVHHQEVTTAT